MPCHDEPDTSKRISILNRNLNRNRFSTFHHMLRTLVIFVRPHIVYNLLHIHNTNMLPAPNVHPSQPRKMRRPHKHAHASPVDLSIIHRKLPRLRFPRPKENQRYLRQEMRCKARGENFFLKRRKCGERRLSLRVNCMQRPKQDKRNYCEGEVRNIRLLIFHGNLPCPPCTR